jgi:sortase (surface protein transpeptidase)
VRGLKPAVRMAAPEPVVTNQSNCRSGSAQPAMTITIPEVSYLCPVYSGGQASLDAGFVTLITDRGTSPALALHPGDPGTLWIAAHRSSHGGAFAAVPSLTDGAVVTVSDGNTTARYRVVSRVRVQVSDGLVVDAAGQATHAATVDSIIRTDRGGNLAPRLLLQTCDGENFRWMIYADLIATGTAG